MLLFVQRSATTTSEASVRPDWPVGQTKETKMVNAYELGHAAFCEGKQLTDNPFDFNEDADFHIEWNDGWEDAQEDHANGQ